MSLSLFFVVAGCAALGGYLAGREAKRRFARETARLPPLPDDTWRVGDVLSLPGGDDVVLAAEERFVRQSADVARLYTPEIGPAIVLLPPPSASVLAVSLVDIDLAMPPPTRLDIDGHTFVRGALITLDDEAATQIADYAAGDRAAFVIVSNDALPRVYAGRRHRAEDVERLPS